MSEEHVNRKYKDSVFRMAFKDKKELLSLYNAINGTHHENPEELEITTLENAVYMSMKNDVSCCLDMNLQLYEQQSTVNPNMPKRFLEYFCIIMEQMLLCFDIYSSKLIPLPTPKFFIFYNGVSPQPEEKLIKLSDCFVHKQEAPELELIAHQININPGYNEELKKNCPTLMQYVEYVTRVRTYNETMPLKDAVANAIEECINEDILKEFLLKNKAQVTNMSIFEYDEEKHKRTIYEEAFEDGEKKGETVGYEMGLKALVHTLRQFCGDFEAVYQNVIANIEYAHVTREQVQNCYK